MTKSSSPALSRRTVFTGVGAVGALAAAGAVVRGQPATPPGPAAVSKPAQGGGYRLSEHVKQYYASART